MTSIFSAGRNGSPVLISTGVGGEPSIEVCILPWTSISPTLDKTTTSLLFFTKTSSIDRSGKSLFFCVV